MVTDRSPVRYDYLSRRLLTSVVQQDEAAMPRSKWSLDLNPLKMVGLSRERKPPDYDNLYDLAMRSTDAVQDQSGTIDSPWAYYIRGRLDLHHGVFSPHMGWNGHVACYRGETTTTDGEPVFIALFGSASNLIGWQLKDEPPPTYTPSDMPGLYLFLDAIREAGDPEVEVMRRTDDYGMSDQGRVESALQHAKGGARTDIGPRDFLATVLIREEEFKSRAADFEGRVLICAPLWIATPLPRPLSS
ncbi:MAG: DUF7019 family protein [Jatrophihabitantaceae bacterium]